MKNLHKLFPLAALVILLSGCTEVIDINLNDQDPQIMIEGVITNDSTQAPYVLLTKTVNFDESNIFPAVTGAQVVISDNEGNTEILTEVSPGRYEALTLKGVPGRTYNLSVTAEGEAFTSSSTMPEIVTLDSLRIVDFSFGPNSTKAVVPLYDDPIGKGNNYRFKLKANEATSASLFLFDDLIGDGTRNQRPLFDPDLGIESGDTVTVSMMCIDAAVNLYFYSLSQNAAGPNASATPANPVTNIQGATLGYFSTHTYQELTVVAD